MARLRTLHVGTETIGGTMHHRRIIVLDQVDPDVVESIGRSERRPDVPPILAFDFPVDIPEEDQNEDHDDRVVLNITGDDPALIDMIRKQVRAEASEAPVFR